MAFQRVASVSDIPPGVTKVFEVGDRAVAVCNVSGDLYAIEDVCTHDGSSFEQGELTAARSNARGTALALM